MLFHFFSGIMSEKQKFMFLMLISDFFLVFWGKRTYGSYQDFIFIVVSEGIVSEVLFFLIF